MITYKGRGFHRLVGHSWGANLNEFALFQDLDSVPVGTSIPFHGMHGAAGSPISSWKRFGTSNFSCPSVFVGFGVSDLTILHGICNIRAVSKTLLTRPCTAHGFRQLFCQLFRHASADETVASARVFICLASTDLPRRFWQYALVYPYSTADYHPLVVGNSCCLSLTISRH